MFETAMVATLPRRRLAPQFLLAAFSFHAAALALGIGASFWRVEALSMPPLRESFVVVSLPSLPDLEVRRPDPKPAPHPPAGPRPANAQPEQPASPNPPPVSPEALANLPIPTGDPEPSSGGDPEYGTNTGPASNGGGDCLENCDPAGGGDGDEPIVLRAGVTPPQVISRVNPVYPELDRRVRREGVVIVEAVIDQQGRVANARLLKGVSIGLDQAALAAVREWRFSPARIGDRPVSVYFTLTVRFSLQ
ncbi:MAG TPA: TonB family protein [Thermoanaerobaculia bacterium]|nr:TonB family protein [Thermoanaerobaculia bacterium]